MPSRDTNRISRRTFLQGTSALGGSALLCHPGSAQDGSSQELPRRVLGRTQEKVSVLGLGTWPCGKSDTVDAPGVERIVREAIDLGINFIDTARNYGNAEEGIGRALATQRDHVFLTTKTWADTADEARSSFEQSLRELKTDHIDLLYLHSMGNRDAERLLADDGALGYLLRQKEAGKVRYLGISGHSKVETFIPMLETRKIDVVMMAMNFVDRHIYGFEDTVLPVANRLGVGVACMKVFGGIRGGFSVAVGPNPGPQMQTNFLTQAVRYAMGLPGVATLVIGPHTVQQLRQNVEMVKNFKPLSEDEWTSLAATGRKLAEQWGPHYGPVA